MNQIDMNKIETNISLHTSLGLISLLIWSASVVLSRATSEELGKYTAGATIYLIGGVLACLLTARKPQGLKKMVSLPKKYLLICGCLFVMYIVLFYVAIGLASTSKATVVVGLINYFWPTFIIVFSIPILGRKSNWLIFPGVIFSMIGVYLAATSDQNIGLVDIFSSGNKDYLPYSLAFLAAISWGLYTNFSQKFGGKGDDALPIFLLACGIVLLILRLFAVEHSVWSVKSILLVIFTILFPVVLAYSFWDIGIRKGNAILISALSYFTPIFSTIMTGVFLGVTIDGKIWLGCALVTIGAILCKFAFTKQKP